MQQEIETQLRAEVHALKALIVHLLAELAVSRSASTTEAMARIIAMSQEVRETVRRTSLEAGSNEIATRAEEMVEKMLGRAQHELGERP